MSRGGIGVDSKQGSFLLFLLILVAVCLRSIPGLADNPISSKNASTSSKNAVDAEATPDSSNNRHGVFFICLGVAGIVILSIILFKLWQKKKREEQHARLLRLFEEDDELELELGLRD